MFFDRKIKSYFKNYKFPHFTKARRGKQDTNKLQIPKNKLQTKMSA